LICCLFQGFYIVTYALGIYYLNLFLAFLTPKIDPAFDFESEDEDGPTLPSKGSEEFRPFMRRLPEFKFWYSTVKATVIAFTCTFFDIFNVPVFWPILVMYFIVLTCLTMKRQIMVYFCFEKIEMLIVHTVEQFKKWNISMHFLQNDL
uniref:Protein RER1 n=1 Tax=Onchocerca flexuosa TaxID=387005 RepID=A0A183HS01_9BILA